MSNFEHPSKSPLSYPIISSPEFHSTRSSEFSGEEVTEKIDAPTAAVKVQTIYRSYRTRRMLADSAILVEKLWCQNTVSRWSRARVRASKVGKGYYKDSKAKKLAFQHWLEAIDPRHRYGFNLLMYYDVWIESDSTQPFFYWLDIGDGKEVNLEQCSRFKLAKQCIRYLGPKERESYEYTIIDGKFIHKQTGDLFDTNKELAGAKWIFVVSTSKNIYAGVKTGTLHHSSFLAGGAAIAAGRLEAEQGILKFISAYTRNYQPTDDTLGSLLSFLKENGVNLDEVKICKPTEDYSDSYNDSTSIQDANAVEVPTNSELREPDVPKEVMENLSTESLEDKQTQSYNVSTSIRDANAVEVPTNSELPEPDVPKEVLENLSTESLEVKQTQSYNVSTSIRDANAVEVPINSELPESDVPKEVLENLSTESLEVKQTQSYNGSTSIRDANAVEVPTNSELPKPDVPKEVLENLYTESLEVKQTQSYNVSASIRDANAVEVPTNSELNSELPEPDVPKEVLENLSTESLEVKQTQTKSNYERTLSGGLQSPRVEVPKKATLRRIHLQQVVKSYQLGNQLSLKWTTGTGPRIRFVAEYPAELRMQALEFVKLSQRTPPTPCTSLDYKQVTGLASPTANPTFDSTPRTPATPITSNSPPPESPKHLTEISCAQHGGASDNPSAATEISSDTDTDTDTDDPINVWYAEESLEDISSSEQESLNVSEISQLKRLPPKLYGLKIEGCDALKSLPEELMCNNPYLRRLYIISCHFLKSIHARRLPIALKTLSINKCEKLEFLSPEGRISEHTSLEHLCIESSCDSLNAFPLAFFPKLRSLSIQGCANFNSISIGLEDHKSLDTLEIRDCTQFKSFPEGGLRIPNLTSILLSNCKNLKALPGQLHSLSSLQSLFINECPELESIPEGGLPSSLNLFCISSCHKLTPHIEWGLHKLNNFSRIEIEGGCRDLESFPERNLLPRNLNSLRISRFPNLNVLDYIGFQLLTSLETLKINSCNKLQSLPEEGLPSSLSYLYISDCPLLKSKLQNRRGKEWYKIAHIPHIQIDGKVIA